MKRVRRHLLAPLLVVPVLVIGTVMSPHVYASSQTFSSPGKSTFTVPAGVSSLIIDALGGQGGNSGGLGGETVATVPVTAGSVLEVTVGAAGTIGGVGSNGGGGAQGTAGSGGDASDVRADSNPPGCATAMNCPAANRIVVAGGGGGNESCGGNASGAGNGGFPGVDGYSAGGSAAGGGRGGTNSAAGAGGAGAGQGTGLDGSPGDPTGDGDGGNVSTCNGGGGGGGLNGGGGGGSSSLIGVHGGGGGGGSNFGPAGSTFTTGVQSGNGKVTITYRLDTTTTVVPGSNPSPSSGPVTVTAVISPAPAGGGTSNVQFSVDGVDFGNPVTVDPATGKATSPDFSSLSAGTHAIRARYLGNADYTASPNSAAFALVLNGAPGVPVPNTGGGQGVAGHSVIAGSLMVGGLLILLFGLGTARRRHGANS